MPQKKRKKIDYTKPLVKTDLSFSELLKAAVDTPLPKKFLSKKSKKKK